MCLSPSPREVLFRRDFRSPPRGIESILENLSSVESDCVAHQPNRRLSVRRGFVDRLIGWRILLFLLAVVLAVAAFPASGQLEFDRSVENLFAEDDPLLVPYQRLARAFGGNEIVLAVYTDNNLFAPDASGLERLAETSGDLASVPGVKAALSIDQPIGEEVLGGDSPQSQRIRDLFEGYTHSADGRVVGIVCLLDPKQQTSIPRGVTIEQLREVIRRRPEGMLAGVPVMIHDGFTYVEADGQRLGWSSSILLAAVIILNFRSIRWVIVPIAVVQWALLMTRATLAWSGMHLSMVSSMLTAIVTVVGIATVVHIIVRYREGRSNGNPPRAALAWAGVLLTGPIFWACATDAAGFGSLLTAGVGPVQDFGLMMAIGVLLVMTGVALLVPALALTGQRGGDPRRAWGEGILEQQLGRTARLVRRRPRTIGIVAAVSTAIAAAGVYRLDVETDFTRNFRSDSPIARSYRFVESRLGGVGMWDILLPAPEHLDWDYLMRVERLESRLRKEVVVRGPDGKWTPGLSKVLSLADMITAAAPFDLGSVRSSVLRNAGLSAGLKLFEKKMPAAIEILHGEDPRHAGDFFFRILLRAPERQPSARKLALIEQVERITREEFPLESQRDPAQVTGMFVLLTHLVDSIIRDQWITFTVATAGIALMMCVAFRSLTLALLALVPNVAPILVVMGLMGWAGLKINVGAAMIAAVSIGLAIDSSVHYITSFQRARREGKSASEAIDLVQQSVGRAVVFSTVALIIGFLSLVTSQFIPTIYFGALVSLTMLGGLLGNLVILPLLLSFLPDSNPKSTRPAA